uniref:Uncharacterized protein n=1 Tax=Magallana gigas TaxID=29159 RepID=A0A8W8IXE0_MAGGI
MDKDFYILLALVLLQYQMCECGNRYCQEAVDSLEIVTSCPTSKIEWEIAAGHCTEFNVHGGVIQDQMSTPCNNTFPKCDSIYNSSDAYKYPDCYTLVTNGEVSSTTPNFTTKLPSTFTRITSEAPDFVQEQIKKEYTWIIIAAVLLFVSLISIISVALRRKKLFPCYSPTSQHTRFIIGQAFNVCSKVFLLSFLQNENLSFSEGITLANGFGVMISITSIPNYALKRCDCGNQRLPARKTLKALCSETSRHRGKMVGGDLCHQWPNFRIIIRFNEWKILRGTSAF